MPFKVLVGSARKGGTTQQQADVVVAAVNDLESQLNAPEFNVESVQGVFVHDLNPLETEVIAIVKTKDIITKKGA